MAKGSANEKALGALHAKITEVFQKVLARYEARLDVLDTINPADIEDEVLREIMEDGAMPNPAMLSAITKFLKDNEISFDTEQLTELSDQERRLAERREKRTNLASLSHLQVVGNG
jgi:hypothetical protein